MWVNLHLMSEEDHMKVNLLLVSEVGSHVGRSTFGVRSGITCG